MTISIGLILLPGALNLYCSRQCQVRSSSFSHALADHCHGWLIKTVHESNALCVSSLRYGSSIYPIPKIASVCAIFISDGYIWEDNPDYYSHIIWHEGGEGRGSDGVEKSWGRTSVGEITHGSFFLNVQLCTQLLIVGLQGTKKTLKTNLTSINCFFLLATKGSPSEVSAHSIWALPK